MDKTVYLGMGGFKMSDLKKLIAILNEHGEANVVGHCGVTLLEDILPVRRLSIPRISMSRLRKPRHR